MQRFIEREHPRVTIWYHQALQIVVKSTGDAKLEKLYSTRSGLPRKALPRYHGTAISWQNHTFPGDTAFVVELPGGRAPGGRRPPPRERRAVARSRGGAAARGREADPYGAGRRAGHGRLRAAPLRHPRLAPARPEGDRRALHRHVHLRARLQPVLAQRAGPGAARAARHLLALRDRPRRHDLPAREADNHVPPHRRPELRRDRHRARGHERRAGDGRPPPARGLAPPHARPPGPLRDRRPERDRAQREPVEPVPPRERAASPHARRTPTSRSP